MNLRVTRSSPSLLGGLRDSDTVVGLLRHSVNVIDTLDCLPSYITVERYLVLHLLMKREA